MVHHVGKEYVGALATQLDGGGDQVVGRRAQDALAHGGGAGEGYFCNARAGGQRLARFLAEAVDDVDHAGRQQVANQLHQHHDGGRRLLGGLHHHAATGGQRGRQLPRSHQQREVPGNDLADHADRLMEVVCNRGFVDLGDAAFLRADGAREVAEMVDGQRNVGRHGFAQRLAVVDGFGDGQRLQMLLHAVGDLQQDVGALGDRGLGPGGLCGVGGVQGAVHILGVGLGDLGEGLAGDGGDVFEVAASRRGHPFAADVVVVLLFVGVGGFEAETLELKHVHGLVS